MEDTQMTFTPYNKLFLLLTALLFLLILPSVMADPEQYLTPGVTHDNSYNQEGTGHWTGRTATTYVRSANFAPYTSPLVTDLDLDGSNEIILTTNTSLQVLNFTSGTGNALKDDYNYGSHTLQNFVLYASPGLINYNGGTDTEIIYYNSTHVFTLNYSASTISLIQTASTATLINNTGTPGLVNDYFAVKCTTAGTVSTGDDTCVMLMTNRTGAGTYGFLFVVYNLDDNTVWMTTVAGAEPTNHQMQPYHQFSLADGDDDGFYEAYFSIDEAANGDFTVEACEISDTPSCKIIRHEDNAVGTTYSDVIVNRLDGANEVATWWYEDGNNYYAKSVKINDNSTISSAYCGVLTCPEGNYASENLIEATDTTYCDFSGDVYYYIRNYDQTDPGANIDTVMCLSQYAGAGYKETEVSNANKNDTDGIFSIHQASMYGTTGIQLPEWAVQGGTKQSLPSMLKEEVSIPVDVQSSGSLDILGQNFSHFVYYDDSYTNLNTIVSSIAPNTGNSICTGETLQTTLTISDNESDAGDCFIRVNYANGTAYGNYSASTFTGGQTSVLTAFTYVASVPTQFIHYYSCKDTYHSAYAERAYSVSYSNATCGSGLCNCGGFGAPIQIEYAANVTAADDVFDNVWDQFGVTSTKSKGIIGIAVIIGIMVLVAKITMAPFAIVAAGLLGTILVTFMGLISAYILILILVGLVLFVIIGKFVTGGSGGGGG